MTIEGTAMPPAYNRYLVHQAGCSFGLIMNIGTDPGSMELVLKFYW